MVRKATKKQSQKRPAKHAKAKKQAKKHTKKQAKEPVNLEPVNLRWSAILDENGKVYIDKTEFRHDVYKSRHMAPEPQAIHLSEKHPIFRNSALIKKAGGMDPTSEGGNPKANRNFVKFKKVLDHIGKCEYGRPALNDELKRYADYLRNNDNNDEGYVPVVAEIEDRVTTTTTKTYTSLRWKTIPGIHDTKFRHDAMKTKVLGMRPAPASNLLLDINPEFRNSDLITNAGGIKSYKKGGTGQEIIVFEKWKAIVDRIRRCDYGTEDDKTELGEYETYLRHTAKGQAELERFAEQVRKFDTDDDDDEEEEDGIDEEEDDDTNNDSSSVGSDDSVSAIGSSSTLTAQALRLQARLDAVVAKEKEEEEERKRQEVEEAAGGDYQLLRDNNNSDDDDDNNFEDDALIEEEGSTSRDGDDDSISGMRLIDDWQRSAERQNELRQRQFDLLEEKAATTIQSLCRCHFARSRYFVILFYARKRSRREAATKIQSPGRCYLIRDQLNDQAFNDDDENNNDHNYDKLVVSTYQTLALATRPWALLDPHSMGDASYTLKPIKKGKTYRLPEGITRLPSECVTGSSTIHHPPSPPPQHFDQKSEHDINSIAQDVTEYMEDTLAKQNSATTIKSCGRRLCAQLRVEKLRAPRQPRLASATISTVTVDAMDGGSLTGVQPPLNNGEGDGNEEVSNDNGGGNGDGATGRSNGSGGSRTGATGGTGRSGGGGSDGGDDGDGDGGGGGDDDAEKEQDKDKDKNNNEDEDDDDDKNEEKKNNDDAAIDDDKDELSDNRQKSFEPTATSMKRDIDRFNSLKSQEIAQLKIALETKDNKIVDLCATHESVIKSNDDEIKKNIVQLKRKAEELNQANNNYDRTTMEIKRLKLTNKNQETSFDQLQKEMDLMKKRHTDEINRRDEETARLESEHTTVLNNNASEINRLNHTLAQITTLLRTNTVP